MTMTVVITAKRVFIQLRIKFGRMLSMVSISLEKRFRMRPMGVVSKKHMGERRMLCSMCVWKARDASTVP